MWAIEASPSPKVAYLWGGIILNPAILLHLCRHPLMFAYSHMSRERTIRAHTDTIRYDTPSIGSDTITIR